MSALKNVKVQCHVCGKIMRLKDKFKIDEDWYFLCENCARKNCMGYDSKNPNNLTKETLP